ncbi:MAG: transketolase [Candidatus Sericytochromatia bacterium]
MHPRCQQIRQHVLQASHASGHGHIPTSFSVVEMLYATYAQMQHRPEDPAWAERDVFILSKGHAALGYYATLAEFGYLSPDELSRFGAYGSRLGCHADRLKVPGVEASTGSLGHGIGIAVGMALAFKLQRSQRRVFVLIGDGEANEGSVWEAAMVAADQKLSNLTLLYDHNQSQIRCLQIGNPADRFAAFGWKTSSVNGHDTEALGQALQQPGTDQPHALICHTRKGHGCESLASDMFAWHRRSPNAQELTQLLEELHAQTV